jgi:Na+-transporting NADH:ubiquinone oxidoreductase subunit F
MNVWMRKIHRWLGLLVGLQLLVWMISGLMMSVFDADAVKGKAQRAPAAIAPAWPADALPLSQVLPADGKERYSVSTGWLVERPVYRVKGEQGLQLHDARSGALVTLDAPLAQRLAQAAYRGDGSAQTAQRVPRSLETRRHDGSGDTEVWRVDFDDAQGSTVYLSLSGDVLELRNDLWRWFDIFWMLHIMDYTERADFNNPLLVTAGIAGLWMSLTGIWLLLCSFSVADFLPAGWRGRHQVKLSDADGAAPRSLRLSRGSTVFAGLAAQGLHLPSTCGGGQSCGLCQVRVLGDAPPPTDADRAVLGADKLKLGYRLGCNLTVNRDLDLQVQGAAALAQRHEARVVSVHAVTPLLREIVLQPTRSAPLEVPAGAYVQLEVPPYALTREQLHLDDAHRADIEAQNLPAHWGNDQVLRRAYSVSTPVNAEAPRLSLLVRLCGPDPARGGRLPGLGSSYVYSLRAGDLIDFSGPFGDFGLRDAASSHVFIGGGAGMAPLRAMVLQLLARGGSAPIHFWYGARSLRDTPYLEEMQALALRHAHFHWHLVLSADTVPDDEEAASTGLVHERVRNGLLPALADGERASSEFYVCGPPAMLAATRQMLKKAGVPAARVQFDDFKI